MSTIIVTPKHILRERRNERLKREYQYAPAWAYRIVDLPGDPPGWVRCGITKGWDRADAVRNWRRGHVSVEHPAGYRGPMPHDARFMRVPDGAKEVRWETLLNTPPLTNC